jgi:hypothetical protein
MAKFCCSSLGFAPNLIEKKVSAVAFFDALGNGLAGDFRSVIVSMSLLWPYIWSDPAAS